MICASKIQKSSDFLSHSLKTIGVRLTLKFVNVLIDLIILTHFWEMFLIISSEVAT